MVLAVVTPAHGLRGSLALVVHRSLVARTRWLRCLRSVVKTSLVDFPRITVKRPLISVLHRSRLVFPQAVVLHLQTPTRLAVARISSAVECSLARRDRFSLVLPNSRTWVVSLVVADGVRRRRTWVARGVPTSTQVQG